MTYTNRPNFLSHLGQTCPHGDVFGECDRGACDE